MDSTLAGIVAILTVIVTVITLGWTIISSRQQARDAKENTKQLDQLQRDVDATNRLHDQSVQLLYRAREAVIAIHKAHVYLLDYVAHKESVQKAKNDYGDEKFVVELDDPYFTKHAEISAAKAELRGLAFAIGDAKLLELVNNPKHMPNSSLGRMESEMDMRGNSQQLHTRISELLIVATTIGNKTEEFTPNTNLDAQQSVERKNLGDRLTVSDQHNDETPNQNASITHRDSARS